MASDAFLVVCESFYSLQGEGKSHGVPAVFLRLAGCNLQCKGFTYKDPDNNEHLGCDSKQLWREGQRRGFTEIIAYWRRHGWLACLAKGAHLVITGGEPLLQQRALMGFIAELDKTLAVDAFIEIETNATLSVVPELVQRINQFNVSPKLAHSGEPVKKAYHAAVLAQFADCSKSVFKFVVASPEDVNEIITRYVTPFAIASRRVWLMPEGGTQASINAKKAWLAELCKQHLFNFTSRLQIDVWQEVVGV